MARRLPRLRTCRVRLFVCALIVLPCAWALAEEVGTGISVWSDSDGTTVISPRARSRLTLQEDETYLSVSYAADIWTSASIDIRTAATKPFVEQRDEINASVDHEMSDVKLAASYRLSTEPDYLANSGSFSVSHELAGGAATLEGRLSASHDKVGRSGDPTFSRGLNTIGARVAYTQIIDPSSLFQLAYEVSRSIGFQSSPYRFVGIGGDNLCAGTAQFCIREAHPGIRTRNAIVGRIARTLGESASVSAGYRFYFDDWGLSSHTFLAQLSYLPDEKTTLALHYRFHMQGAANFYRSRYDQLPTGESPYVSRDRELSSLNSHRLTISYEKAFDLFDTGPTLRTTVALGGTMFRYADFIGLSNVRALDLTVAATVDL